MASENRVRALLIGRGSFKNVENMYSFLKTFIHMASSRQIKCNGVKMSMAVTIKLLKFMFLTSGML